MSTTLTALTPEQRAIISAATASPSANLIVEARAGSGKTTLLLELVQHLKGNISLQAFNKAIAEEIKLKAERLPFAARISLDISTVHGFGLRTLSLTGRKPTVQGGKLNFILKDQLQRYGSDDDLQRNRSLITKLASFAKQAGLGVTSTSPLDTFASIDDQSAWQALADHYDIWRDLAGETTEADILHEARQLLRTSNAKQSAVDFDDMIYLPLLLNLPIPQYAHVLLDEAQDINDVRRELAFRSAAERGRVIAVGDPYQAIYSFTGANARSLDLIATRGAAQTFPLTICWRCDNAIIAAAQRIVPDIQPRPKAGPGLVERIGFLGQAEVKAPDGSLKTPAVPSLIERLQPGDVVLCRLNRPNIATALLLLRAGKRCRIEGRDIGSRLLSHARAATDLHLHQSLADTLLDLESYAQTEVARLVNKNKSEATIALFEDEVAACQLLLERALELNPKAGWPALEALVESLFGDQLAASDFILLSSIHKAKGREWPRVFILGKPDYLPFHMATLEWELEAERNLEYVAITRAQHELYLVSGVQAALDNR